MRRSFRISKKSTVQLTSLLDLLFVMVFLSLVQQKEVIPSKKPIKKSKTIAVKKKVKKEVKKPIKTFYSVKATFHFYGTNTNPNIPSGKYLMQGSYDKKTGKLQLGGVAWLNRPANYDMVPLSGVINGQEDSFTGRIEFIGCKKFTLTRKIKKSGNPISGEWVGKYNCSQGDTGLTLSIE
jgi:hypothetical protein